MKGRALSIVLAALCWALPVAALAAGDAEAGRKIAKKHCSRCHVVDDNKYAGINSTPSFHLLAKRDDYLDRFQTFYDRRPHPSFVRVPGVPPWTDIPPPITPFEITLEQVDDILSYVETLRPQ